MKYFVLIKKKGSKKWLGAIPARKGASLSSLKKSIKSGAAGFVYKIISLATLKRLVLKIGGPIRRRISRVKRRIKRRVKRRVKRRKTRKRKVKRRVKRIRVKRRKPRRRRKAKRRRKK